MTGAHWVLVLAAVALIAALLTAWDFRRLQHKAAAALRADHQQLRAVIAERGRLIEQMPPELDPMTAYDALTAVMQMLDKGERRHLSRCTPAGDEAYDQSRSNADLYACLWLNVRDMRDGPARGGQE